MTCFYPVIQAVRNGTSSAVAQGCSYDLLDMENKPKALNSKVSIAYGNLGIIHY